MSNTIEQRAEAKYPRDAKYAGRRQMNACMREGYITGATEERALMEHQTASLEARVKEFAATILAAKQLLEAEYIGEAIDLLETKSKILNHK